MKVLLKASIVTASIVLMVKTLLPIPANKPHLKKKSIAIIDSERKLQNDDEFHTPTIAKALQADYFQLKLYWEDGYFWQEDEDEKRWCVECLNRCSSQSLVIIRKCDKTEKKQRWILKNDKLSPYSAPNLCMYFKDRTMFRLRTCKASRDKYQKFDLIKQHIGRNLDSYEFRARNKCMTQRHHPKSDERLRLEPCQLAKKSDTNIWQFGGPWDGHP